MLKYFDSLDGVTSKRYVDTTAIIGFIDPYAIESARWSSDPQHYPPVTYIDMVKYFVLGSSPFYSMKDFKNYKSLNSYDRFVAGWVNKFESATLKSNSESISHIVVRTKVIHSQQMNESFL